MDKGRSRKSGNYEQSGTVTSVGRGVVSIITSRKAGEKEPCIRPKWDYMEET